MDVVRNFAARLIATAKFPVVDLQAAQHSIKNRAVVVIFVVGGDEDRVNDIAVFEFACVELRAFASSGRRRASSEGECDHLSPID